MSSCHDRKSGRPRAPLKDRRPVKRAKPQNNQAKPAQRIEFKIPEKPKIDQDPEPQGRSGSPDFTMIQSEESKASRVTFHGENDAFSLTPNDQVTQLYEGTPEYELLVRIARSAKPPKGTQIVLSKSGRVFGLVTAPHRGIVTCYMVHIPASKISRGLGVVVFADCPGNLESVLSNDYHVELSDLTDDTRSIIFTPMPDNSVFKWPWLLFWCYLGEWKVTTSHVFRHRTTPDSIRDGAHISDIKAYLNSHRSMSAVLSEIKSEPQRLWSTTAERGSDEPKPKRKRQEKDSDWNCVFKVINGMKYVPTILKKKKET